MVPTCPAIHHLTKQTMLNDLNGLTSTEKSGRSYEIENEIEIMAAKIRINKYIAGLGIASRRAADELLADGRITINGETAGLGEMVDPQSDRIELDGRPLKVECAPLPYPPYGKASPPRLTSKDDNQATSNYPQRVYIALNKPKGIVCTTDSREPENITEYMNFPIRIFPIGRLDKASSGLLLLTNDGSIVNRILRAHNHHEKEYRVEVDKPLTEAALQTMRTGVPILGVVTLPCRIKLLNPTTMTIILTQGLNRQIRRMCEYCGYKVVKLERRRIMNITLGKMPVGAWRYLTYPELSQLDELLIGSSESASLQQKMSTVQSRSSGNSGDSGS